MTKTLLMVAFEFPPSNGASVPRIESFYRYLKQWGWQVIVLTAKPHAYSNKNSDYCDDLGDLIYRTTALDVQKQLSFKGKYLEIIATPDRWGLTWIPSAIFQGKQLIKKYQPDVIWSSSPIPSTHYIANKLSKLSGKPWVADYRDPFHYMNGTAGQWLDRFHKRIDKTTLANATQLTFATSAVKGLYLNTYEKLIAEKSTVIENGYDETNFEKLNTIQNTTSPFSKGKFSLYYSGVLYPNGRDPIPVFEALSQLNSNGSISADNFELIFQGAGNGAEFENILTKLKIKSLVKFISPVPFLHALNNMQQSSALLLIQDKRFSKQIPGKVYEYLRTGKPILLKTNSNSETSKLTSNFIGTYEGEQAKDIAQHIKNIISLKSTHFIRDLKKYNRKEKAIELEEILNSLI